MKTVRFKLESSKSRATTKPVVGRVNVRKLIATTEADIQAQAREDDTAAAQDAALFAQRVRKRLGLTQVEFSQRIDVSLDTIRNWEQGKRSPTGAAKALLRVLDRAPEASLAALGSA
jgi:putative transcriptional regulator